MRQKQPFVAWKLPLGAPDLPLKPALFWWLFSVQLTEKSKRKETVF